MRKNKISGAIPGAGRPKKNYVKKNLNLSPEAAKVLESLPFGQAGEFVSKAIISLSLEPNSNQG